MGCLANMRHLHMRCLTPGIRSLHSANAIQRSIVAYRPQPPSHYLTAPRYSVVTKRSASSAPETTKTKTQAPRVAEYHETPSLHDESGDLIWPAPEDEIDRARQFIRECVAAEERVLIVPDKGADGLAAGVILQKTLVLLGLDPSLISVHLVQKGGNIHYESEREAMLALEPAFIFVLDHRARKSKPIIDAPHRALIIDHHLGLDNYFPEGSEYVTACNTPPFVTTSFLTYHLCLGLHEEVAGACDWLCIIGMHSNPGTAPKWGEYPLPDMKPTFKRYTRKALTEAVSLLNAAKRTATGDVSVAWETLSTATEPAELLQNPEVQAARVEVQSEVKRCSRIPPKFSADGRIASFRINSESQVHPIVTMRWAGHLQSPGLEVVLVANEGYLPDMVCFTCRIPRYARNRNPPVNIVEVLRSIVERAPDPTVRDRLSVLFATGHPDSSGGILLQDEFEEFMELLEIGKKVEKPWFYKSLAGFREEESDPVTNNVETKPASE